MPLSVRVAAFFEIGMYDKILEIIATMDCNGYDFRAKFPFRSNIALNTLTLNDHVKALIYAQLSSNRPWEGIASNFDNIDRIFCNFDLALLKQRLDKNSETLIDEIKAIKCGNRQISKQIESLKDNISVLETINANEKGGINTYYANTSPAQLTEELSKGRYKLKFMGVPLVCEYLKNIGVDTVKPDVHICRILGRLGYSVNSPDKAGIYESIAICNSISINLNIPVCQLDSILWQYCAKGKFEECTAKTQCRRCLVTDCPSRGLPHVD